MKTEELFIQVLTPHSIVSKRDGERILRALLDNLSVTPDFYENWEPIKTPFDAADLSGPLEKWGERLLWKTRRNRISGSMRSRFGKIIIHGSVYVCDKKKSVTDENAKAFVHVLSEDLNADFAYIHLLTEEDIEMGKQNRTVMSGHPKNNRDFILYSTTHELRKYVPDLYWGTVFGPAYVRLFGKERLLSSPAYRVEDWGEEMVYIQLSESYMDMANKFDEVDAVRREVKAHLDNNAFFDPELGTEHTYNVPEFHFLD